MGNNIASYIIERNLAKLAGHKACFCKFKYYHKETASIHVKKKGKKKDAN